MNQIAFIPAGCAQTHLGTVIATPTYLCYASTISIYIHANAESESYPLLRVLTGPQNTMSSFSLNEEVVACITPMDKKVFLWEASTGDAFEQVPNSMFGDNTPVIVSVNPSQQYSKRIAFGCDGGIVVVWDVNLGRSFIVDVGGTRSTVVSVMEWSSHSPHLLAVGTRNGVVTIVDTVTQRVRCEVDCFDSLRPSKESLLDRLLLEAPKVSAISFDPFSPTYILAASVKGFIVMIDIEQSNVVQAFEPTAGPITSIAFLRDQPGGFITTDGATSSLQVWNVSSKQSLRSIRAKGDEVAICAVPVPPPAAASSSLSPSRNASSANLLGSLTSFNVPSNIDAIQRGPNILIAFRNGSVSLFNLETCKVGLLDTAPGHCETVFDCRFATHDPDLMSSCSFDGTIRIWDVKRMLLNTTINARKAVYCADWSPAGDMILAGLLGGEAAVFSVSSGKEIWRKKFGDDVIWRVTWCRSEAGIVALASRDGTVTVAASQDGKTLRAYRHSSSAFGVDFDPVGGRIIAVGCYDNKARLYHLESDRAIPVATLVGHEGEISQIAFNRQFPNILATTSNDRTVRVWSLPEFVTKLMAVGQSTPQATTDGLFLQPILTLSGHTNRTRGLCWHPLCPYLLLSGSWDSTIRMWDTRSGACLHVGRAHAADVYSISCHPERPMIIVTASRDTTIRFWFLHLLSQLYLDAAFGVLREDVVSVETIKIGGGIDPKASVDKMQLQLPCSGPEVTALLARLDAEPQPHQRLKHIAKFFDFPYGAADIVSCASFAATKSLMTIDPSATVAPTDHLANVAITTANARADELRKKKISAAGSSNRDTALKNLASDYLRLGDTKEYCSLMLEAGNFDAAVGAAPAVSAEHWRLVCKKAAKLHIDQGDYAKAVDYLIMCGESHQAADILASVTQFSEAVVVVQSCTQASQSTQSFPPLLAEVDARVTANKIVSFAKANAARYLVEGNALLACASLIAADSLDQGVQLVLRSACIPMGHLLFHTLAVPRELLDYGFSQSLLMSASHFRWRTATLALDRLSEPLRLAAAADALAMVISDASYTQQYKFDVERALEPYFRISSNDDVTTANFGISLWNVAIQSNQGGAAAHNEAILKRCADDLRIALAEMEGHGREISDPMSPTRSRGPVRIFENVRRWLHFTVSTAEVPVEQRQRTLFLAFLCAALLAQSAYQYENLVASALRLAATFVDNGSTQSIALLASTRTVCSIGVRRGSESYRCLPLGAKLPSRIHATERTGKSVLSDRPPRGPVFILEDNESLVSLQEALEWYRCCWFSPLATSQRILPF
ncbi:WD40 repeat-containing protein, putative [Bodo saltans]|uniref:WD40 repeat-containing protein, putative n=1 Tax=Bodo saltans TaxID=75058 RepID=A0A0S4J0X0_BODSA|nr:WD40 repeat-containing protein, putative [Bodo saltans]|eukprot:CUG00695.1 WD40 repeat-containing protein, putative [Bodo saltans]